MGSSVAFWKTAKRRPRFYAPVCVGSIKSDSVFLRGTADVGMRATDANARDIPRAGSGACLAMPCNG